MTNKADCIAGVGFMALGAAIYKGASGFKLAEKGMGAGGFPKFLAIIIALLGLLLVITAYLKLRQNPEGDKKVLNGKELLMIALMVALFGLYLGIIKTVGYPISTAVFTFVFFYIYGDRKWLRMIIISILFTAITYILFRNVFYVMLPMGTLF